MKNSVGFPSEEIYNRKMEKEVNKKKNSGDIKRD